MKYFKCSIFCIIMTAALFSYEEMSFEELLGLKVSTATKTATSIKDIPNKVIIITEDDIKNRNYRYLVDIFDDLPGVQVMPLQQAEHRTHVLVRGIWQNNKILVLFNGLKINPPENRNFTFGDTISLANVKRIEFIYGPTSALYGADAVNGIINIITKDYRDLGYTLETGSSWGRYNKTDSHVICGFESGPINCVILGAFHYSQGPDLLTDYSDFYAPIRSTNIANMGGKEVFEVPSLSYDIQLNAHIDDHTTINYMRTYSEESSSMGLAPDTFEFSKAAVWAWCQDNVSIQNEINIIDSLILRTFLGYNHFEINPKSNFINGFFIPGKFVRDDFKYGRGMRFSIAEELIFSIQKLQAVLGIYYDDTYTLTKVSTVTGEDANKRYPISYQVNPAVPIPENNYQSYGAYLQFQYQIISSLDIIAGIRADKVWYFAPSYNPRIGLVWNPMQNFIFRINYARAFLTPSPWYMFENFSNAAFPGPGTVGGLPNTDLEPEDYDTIDCGFTFALIRNLWIDISGFYSKSDNYLLHNRISEVPFEYTPQIGNTDPLVVSNADAIFANENAGEVQAWGGRAH
ncbi:TonB-dependent receptor plug domain-containing protein [Spirochaetota bacterium]